LEIIFHPLLYKTKMCKSNLKNGVCREYGVYCAKAHNPSDIRNLVQIYGEDWKRHYDLTLRDKLSDSLSAIKSQGKNVKKLDNILTKRLSVGNFCINSIQGSEQTNARTSAKRSPMFTSVEPEIDPYSPMLFTSPLLFGDCTSICEPISTLTLGEGVTSYTQLYGEKAEMVKVVCSDLKSSRSSIPKVPWNCTWHSTGTDVAAPEFSSSLLSNSNFRCPFDKNWKNGEHIDVHWKIDLKVYEDNKESRQSNEDEENFESLFAQPPYEVNWNKNIFDPWPETPERQQHEL